MLGFILEKASINHQNHLGMHFRAAIAMAACTAAHALSLTNFSFSGGVVCVAENQYHPTHLSELNTYSTEKGEYNQQI